MRGRLCVGVDVVKFYADYRKRELRFRHRNGLCPANSVPCRRPQVLLFTQSEIDAMVAEARSANSPIAAHASGAAAVIMAAKAGVTTIEHGSGDEALQAMKDSGVIFVSTLAVLEIFLGSRDQVGLRR